jgi:hypothetical protein
MKHKENESDVTAADRERFLTACGKFAAITPPEIIMLLSTSLVSDAVIVSTGYSPGRTSVAQVGQDVVPSPRRLSRVFTALRRRSSHRIA